MGFIGLAGLLRWVLRSRAEVTNNVFTVFMPVSLAQPVGQMLSYCTGKRYA